jgi:YHS domain-containing protein
MRRIAFIVALAATATMTLATVGEAQRGGRVPTPANQQKVEKARDPVCGLMVEKDPRLAAQYKGGTYYFCSRTDMEQFKKAPERYVKK